MADSTVTISDLGHLNALQSGEDGGHGSTTTAESPTIEPQHHQPKIFFPTWDIIFMVSSAFSLFIDPLVCYVLVIVEKDTCFFWDQPLMWTILALRSIGDLFYYMDIVVFLKRFHTKLSAKSSAGAASTETNDDHLVTKLRNFIHKKPIRFLTILLRIWVALPFLQAILLIGNYTTLDNSKFISLIPFQYILRAYNFYKWLDRRANVETVTRRFLKAILDFLPFIIASHLYGSMWYFFAGNTEIICWQDYICEHEQKCDFFNYNFYCGYYTQLNNELINIPRLKLSCPVELPKNMTSFPHDYGIYLSALQSNMLTSRYLPRKILHCFWWGLRNLSSFGSNLQTSFSTEEIIFSVVISISGLILFLVYLNSRVQGFQKIVVQRRLRQKIKTKYSVLIDQIFIMRLLRMNSLKKVPILGSIDEKVLKAISEHLKPVIYAEDEYIIREGEPLRKILFIRQGTALTYTATGKSGTSVCKCLEKNDLYGEELVVWAFESASFSELPICATTLVSQSKVNAFSITANHLKSVVAEFWWHLRRELPHSQVEYFAASSIQAAWRRHHAKKLRDQQAGTNN